MAKSADGCYIVANYFPAGNVMPAENFAANVLAANTATGTADDAAVADDKERISETAVPDGDALTDKERDQCKAFFEALDTGGGDGGGQAEYSNNNLSAEELAVNYKTHTHHLCPSRTTLSHMTVIDKSDFLPSLTNTRASIQKGISWRSLTGTQMAAWIFQSGLRT